MPFGKIDQRVEDGGFGAVKTCCAESVDDCWSEEGAVEVVRLRHGGGGVACRVLPFCVDVLVI